MNNWFKYIQVTVLALIVTVVFLITGCSSPFLTQEADYAYDKGVASAVYEDSAPYTTSRAGSYSTESNSTHVTTATTRYSILTGSLTLTVADTPKIVAQAKEVAEAAGGLVSSSHLFESREGHKSASVTLRVPSEKFDEVMDQLQDLGKATGVRFNDRDVTMEYVDLEARLKNLQAQEARLREILEMAENVSEVLTVEKELGRIRGEIESMTAQFTYLQDQVLYSTIELEIREETIATGGISPAPFEKLGERLKESFVRSINLLLNGLAGLLVGVTAAIPVVLMLAVIVTAIWRLVVRARRRPPAA